MRVGNANFNIALRIQRESAQNNFAIEAKWNGSGNLFQLLGISAFRGLTAKSARIITANFDGEIDNGFDVIEHKSGQTIVTVEIDVNTNDRFRYENNRNLTPCFLFHE